MMSMFISLTVIIAYRHIHMSKIIRLYTSSKFNLLYNYGQSAVCKLMNQGSSGVTWSEFKGLRIKGLML